MTEFRESFELIARRVPPGDKWELLIDKGSTLSGLVATLEAYVRKTKFKGDFRISPLEGDLYAIREETILKEDPKPEVWDLYGES